MNKNRGSIIRKTTMVVEVMKNKELMNIIIMLVKKVEEVIEIRIMEDKQGSSMSTSTTTSNNIMK